MLTRLPWLLIVASLLATSCRKADQPAPQAAAPKIITTPGGIEMVLIPAGRFVMGSTNAGKQTHEVGKRKPNPWGLYDMLGNVAEWCNDVYQPDYYRAGPTSNPRGPEEGERRVLRGGAWNSTAAACRSAYRVGETPGFQDACFARDAIGFRCVRKAPAASD